MTTTTRERININQLSLSQQIDLAKTTYEKSSYFLELFNRDATELCCKELSILLRNEIIRILLDKQLIKTEVHLEKLHKSISEELCEYNFDDGVNKISTHFYDTDAKFTQAYHQFIKLLRLHFVREPFFFQATPTIRIHCPNAKNSHHYPRYHSDVAYGHPPEEINIWLPLTEVNSGHCFRLMSYSKSKIILEKFGYDFSAFINSAIHDKEFSRYCDTVSHPVLTSFGKLLAFDSRCIHSGEPLKTHTRVSMDIRILPLSQYEKMEIAYQGSGRRKVLFAPGHCYHEQDSDTFLKTTLGHKL